MFGIELRKKDARYLKQVKVLMQKYSYTSISAFLTRKQTHNSYMFGIDFNRIKN